MGAFISPCGRYRYSLTREFDGLPFIVGAGRILWVMLNPSTADATVDDPTIRRVASFSKAWGYSSLEVVNLFAWRATDPDDMIREHRRGTDIVGPDNDEAILAGVKRSSQIVVAWGALPARFHDRAGLVVSQLLSQRTLLSALTSLGVTKLGDPRHPLYLSAALHPSPWPEAR
jgi:hypothetical protein